MNIKTILPQLFILLLIVSCASTQEKLTSAAYSGDEKAIDDILKSKIENINQPVSLNKVECPGHRQLNPLQAASCKGHLAVVKKLIAKKANHNITPMPIFLALQNGHFSVIKYLIESGVNPDVTDQNGSTILIHVSHTGNTSLVKFMLKSGASVKLKNNLGNSAVMLAANTDIAKTLIALGGNIFAVSNNGETPLHLAIWANRIEMIKFFIKNKINIDHLNKKGFSALDYARTQKNSDVIKYLEKVWRKAIAKNIKTGDSLAKEAKVSNALVQYILALNKASDILDDTEMNIRVKIIQYGINQNIPISEKAREHLIRSNYLLKNNRDIKEVISEMRLAVASDPWWVDGYYNLGILKAKQGKYTEAIHNLNIFIHAIPNDPRTRDAQDKIHEFKIAREEADKVRAMTGRWKDQMGRYYSVSINGNKLVINGSRGKSFSLTITNNIISGSVQSRSRSGPNNCTLPGQLHPVNGNLDFDAKGLTINFIWSSYSTRYHCEDILGNASNCCLTCSEVCDAVTILATNNIKLRLTKI